MDAFRWSSVVLSIMLGLGITHLLSSAVGIFRSRGQRRMDWIPLVWAVCIFLWQLQFWWGIIEIPGMTHSWSLGGFLSLVLPAAGSDVSVPLDLLFARDGRWALVALSAYNVMAMFVDWMIWGVPPFSLWGAFLTLLAVLPLVVVLSRRRNVQAAVTLVYVPLSIWAALVLSRSSY
jgi:hypothetical protein